MATYESLNHLMESLDIARKNAVKEKTGIDAYYTNPNNTYGFV